MKYQIIYENIITLVLMTVTILGLYYMSHSFHSLWALLFLLNVNTYKKKDEK